MRVDKRNLLRLTLKDMSYDLYMSSCGDRTLLYRGKINADQYGPAIMFTLRALFLHNGHG